MQQFFQNLVFQKGSSVNLTGGNPFRKGGKWVQDAVIQAIYSEHTGIYPALSGESNDKQIIFDFVATPYELGGLGFNPHKRSQNNIMFAHGSSQIWALYSSLLRKKFQASNSSKTPVILMPELTYGLCKNIAQDQGISVYGIPLQASNGFRLKAKDVEETIRKILQNGDKTILCLKIDNPHNPTGNILEEEETYKIAELCCQHKIKIFEDLVYMGLEYHKKPTPFGSLKLTPKISLLRSLLCSTYSMSKTPGFPDLRIGIAVADSKDISEMCSLLQDNTLGSAYHAQAGFSAFASQENTEKRINFLNEQRAEYDFRRRLMLACIIGKNNVCFTKDEEERIQETIKHLDERKIPEIQKKAFSLFETGIPNINILNKEPDAGFFFLIEIDSHLGNSANEIASKIVKKNGPSILPSSFFSIPRYSEEKGNLHYPHFARITFSFEKPEVILISMISFKKAIQEIQKGNNLHRLPYSKGTSLQR